MGSSIWTHTAQLSDSASVRRQEACGSVCWSAEGGEHRGQTRVCLPTVSLCFPHVCLQFHLGINFQCWAVAAHAFNLTQHLRGRGSLSLRTAWSTEQVSRQPRLYRKTLSQEKKKKNPLEGEKKELPRVTDCMPQSLGLGQVPTIVICHSDCSFAFSSAFGVL